MWKVGDEARHENSRESFGLCKILEINSTTALVQWRKPRARRNSKRPGRTPLTETESHVDLRSLYPAR
jgi:hypothetical protein